MMSNFALERSWNGKSIFIEESPIQSVGDISLNEYMEMDYANCKEGWDALDKIYPAEVSSVKTESGYLASRISQAESSSDIGVELDSHADSPVVGSNCHILRSTGKTVRVSGFANELGKALDVKVVDAVVAYDDPMEGNTYLLVLKNALHVPSMTYNLLPSFMMRLAGIEVKECPKFLSEAPDEKDHSIYFREEGIRIPLQLRSTISLIPTRIPSQDELKLMGTPDIKVMLLTPDSPTWNPHNNSYQQQEFDMTDHHGNIITSKDSLHIINDVTTRMDEPALLCNDLIERLQISNVKMESSINAVNCVMEMVLLILMYHQ